MYIGKICPFCKTSIREGESVTVCPECGIPHHESCWTANGGCTTFGCTAQSKANVEKCSSCGADLSEGQSFCTKCGASRAVNSAKTCSKCGAQIAAGQEFCPSCGQKADLVVDASVSQAINDFNNNVVPEKKKVNIFGIIGLICGCLSFIPVLGFITFLPALICSIIGVASKKCKKGIAIAGLIVTIVSLVVSIVLSVVLIGIIGLSGLGFGEDFNSMYGDLDSNSWCTIASDGSWMEIDSNPYDQDDYLILEACNKIEEINTELGFSSYVYDAMLETSSIDGVQTEYTDGYSVSWSYHPDRGMEVTYRIID